MVLFKSSNKKGDEAPIKIPTVVVDDSSVNATLHDKTPKPKETKEKVIKLKKPQQWMDTIQVVRDTVFDSIPIEQLLEMRLSGRWFNEQINLFFVSRSSAWWSNYWKRTFMDSAELTRNQPEPSMVSIGRISSRTENTTTRNSFFASRQPAEELSISYPFCDEEQVVEEGEEQVEEQESSDNDDMFSDEYETVGRVEKPYFGTLETIFEEIPKGKKGTAISEQLFKPNGLIYESTKITYSSSGKSGSANGSFNKAILMGLTDVEATFKEYQKGSPAKVVGVAVASLRFFFSTLVNQWWLARTDNELTDEKLIVKKTHIKRKREEGRDRYGPTYLDEQIVILSVIHECTGKPALVIGSFLKERSYYG